MRISDADILFIPGLGGSGPGHWQHRWAEKMTTGRTIELPNTDAPDFAGAIAAITAAIAVCERPVMLIGHSLGSIAAVHAARELSRGADGGLVNASPVRAAFLVAPPSSRVLKTLDAADPRFAAVPTDPLPFPSLLVASRNDTYASMEESENMALDWGSQVVDAGEAGHINADSGHGPWPEGLMRLAALIRPF